MIRSLLAACGLLLLALGPAPSRADYLDDPRTARAVGLVSQRAPLRECLRVLSEASEVRLSAAPELGEEYLTAYVPKRPLRETMDALQELFEGAWSLSPPGGASGGGRAYRLVPDAKRLRARAEARTQLLQRIRKALDQHAAEAVRDARGGNSLPDDSRRYEVLALLLWSHLPPADRDRVLRGASVTLSVPETQARAAIRLTYLIAASQAPLGAMLESPPAGPLMATFNLDDQEERALPVLRARATVRYESALTAAIGSIDLTRLAPPPRTAEPEQPTGAALPPDVGENGRFTGGPDEMLLKVGKALQLPILGRYRASAGNAPSLAAGGRRIPQLMADLAAGSEAIASSTARGFYVLRSRTDLLDPSGLPAPAVVREYLKVRPKEGARVPLAALAELGALTPLQLSVLRRSNISSNEADFAYGTHAVLRFYAALNPAQRKALTESTGLEVASLPHAALHALVDLKAKRGDWDIFQKLQQIPGLRFRFQELLDREEDSLTLQALRGEDVVSQSTLTLPTVEVEVAPSAIR